LLIAAAAGAQQCEGDFDGDGQVMINEIVLTVANGLNGCGPALTCPIDFSDNNTNEGTPDCFYIGRWNLSCGAADLETRWASDGEIVIVQFLGFPDGLYFGASVTSPTTADLIGWFTKLDLSDLQDATGELRLDSDEKALVIDPDSVPFRIEDCKFSGYRGALSDVVDPNAQPAAGRLRVGRGAFQRLLGMRAGGATPLNFERR
jgi:hypothetical protein